MAKANGHYQEVQFIRSHARTDEKGNLITEFSRIKVLRPVVKIKGEEAAVLNQGVLTDSRNMTFSYYLKEGEELKNLVIPKK